MQKPEIFETLESSRQEVLAAVEGLSEAQAGVAPEAQWSALHCLEHVVAVEGRFLQLLGMATRVEAPRTDRAKEAMLSARVTDRSTKVKAPELVHPKGIYANVPEALAAFEAARARTVAFAEEHADHLDCLLTSHPRFGEVTGTQLLHLIAAHGRRHAEQIRETVAAS
jgi:uncharacterized damage-inducible protein DinB